MCVYDMMSKPVHHVQPGVFYLGWILAHFRRPDRSIPRPKSIDWGASELAKVLARPMRRTIDRGGGPHRIHPIRPSLKSRRRVADELAEHSFPACGVRRVQKQCAHVGWNARTAAHSCLPAGPDHGSIPHSFDRSISLVCMRRLLRALLARNSRTLADPASHTPTGAHGPRRPGMTARRARRQ